MRQHSSPFNHSSRYKKIAASDLLIDNSQIYEKKRTVQ